MKNKTILALLGAFGLAGFAQATTIPNQTVEFVNVKDLGGDLVVNNEVGGTVKVNATVLARSQRWTRDRVYILANNVIVPSGKTLTIEPGTLIRGERPTVDNTGAVNPSDPGALLIARGGKIYAKGTADAPIIFTSIDDPHVPGGIATIPEYENFGVPATNKIRQLRDMTGGTKTTVSSGVTRLTGGTLRVNGSGGISDGARPYTTTKTSSTADSTIYNIEGSWGGLVLCGYATVVRGYTSLNALNQLVSEPTVNTTTGAFTGGLGMQLVEGMASFPVHGFGGGDDDNDSSGVLSFIDNRYGGYVIAQSSELNSYSFYGVGKNTVLEFLADWNNKDDSYEFWGGAANLRRAISAFPGDDGLDTDQGYLGACQYYIQINNNYVQEDGSTLTGRASPNFGDSLSENDGSESNNASVPYTVYTLANATFIGRGYNGVAFGSTSDGADPNSGPNFKDNGSAQWYNCIVADSSHAAVLITDRNAETFPNHGLTDTYVNADEANDSNGRFGGTRTAGGFDGAGRADDLVTSQTGAPSAPDGLFNNTFFYRCGLATHSKLWLSDGTTVSGKFASKAAFDTAVASNPVSAYTASIDNLFPRATDRNQRHGGTTGVKHRANIPAVVEKLTNAAAYNQFNVNPFAAELSTSHRLSDVDIRPSSAAKTLANSALPARRGINTGANFAGAVRDNAWYVGWNYASQLSGYGANIFGNVSAEAPVLTVSVDSATQKPRVTFGSVSGKKYVLERSTDNRTYAELTTLEANGNSTSYTDPSTWTGAPVFYRVIGL